MFTFLKNGSVVFVRSDDEQAEWTQEELNLVCAFPYDAKKVIERGMTVLFQDPATNAYQAYEIRNCTGYAAEGYQQFISEDIAVSELTDCHIADEIELTDLTITQALNTVLPGTGWSVGTVASGIPVSSGNIGRGNVWQAVCDIRNNWNVHILPRVTVDASGITGRFIDVIRPEGTWRGLRIAVNKNLDDPCIQYDDTELYTALYAYGASYTEGEGDKRQTLERNITGVSWQKTADHPAKPAGQNYIEDPEKTALFGRNGKPRFGYYQNGSIDDPEILLQKTWESLQQCSVPKVSATGTVTDLKRLGFPDVPVRLYDQVIIEIEPFGLILYKQIIQLTVDLHDPQKTRPNIGDYIPNIIYYNRRTDDDATGGGRGRGGGTRSKKKQGEFETDISANERNINLNARQLNEHGDILRQAGMFIDPITGVLIYAEDNENNIGSMFHVQSDQIKAEVKARKDGEVALESSITQTANQILLKVDNYVDGLSTRIDQTDEKITLEATRAKTAEGSLSGRIDVEADKITAEVTRAKGAENGLSGRLDIEADKINLVVTDDGEIDAAAICVAINDEGSSATIKASKIYLLGQTIANTITADYVQSKVGELTVLNVNSIGCSGGAAISGLLNAAGNITTPYIELDGVPVGYAVYDLQIQLSGNTYTLQKQTITGSGWVDVGTFSRATALNGDWSGGTFTVEASPQGNRLQTSVASDPANAYRDGNIIYIPLIDGANESIGKEALCNFTNVLTARSNCVAGLTRYGQQPITLYALVDGSYFSVGQHYWYYKDTNSALTTYYN